jgi:CheY-like chemotaxis protein
MVDTAHRPGYRILVIDDNQINLKLATCLLKARRHTVLLAENGESGIAIARRELPDLILCDIRLPDISGNEVARRLREDPATRRIPMVAVTALAMVGDRENMMAAGFNGYISKPIEPRSFVVICERFVQPVRAGDQSLLV